MEQPTHMHYEIVMQNHTGRRFLVPWNDVWFQIPSALLLGLSQIESVDAFISGLEIDR